MNTTYLIGGAGAVVVLGAGFLLVASPQQSQLSARAEDLAAVQDSNDRTAQRIPKLKAQLAGIAPKVEQLRDLAAQVPPTLDQSSLLNDLSAAASAAGLSGVSNLSVSLPALVKNAEVASAEPDPDEALPADGDEADATQPAGEATSTPSPSPTDAADGSAVIASYDVSMSATGTPEQIVVFMREIARSGRLNVVSSTQTQIAPDGTATVALTTRFFLQQDVDVEGLAAQIESLSTSLAVDRTSTSTPASAPATQD